MTSKKHDEEIEKIRAIFKELGYYTIRIDKRSVPDFMVTKDPQIIAIEVEIQNPTKKGKSLRERMDFQHALLIQPVTNKMMSGLTNKEVRRQVYKKVIELRKQISDQSQIKHIIFQEMGLTIPKATLSEWLSGKHGTY